MVTREVQRISKVPLKFGCSTQAVTRADDAFIAGSSDWKLHALTVLAATRE